MFSKPRYQLYIRKKYTRHRTGSASAKKSCGSLRPVTEASAVRTSQRGAASRRPKCSQSQDIKGPFTLQVTRCVVSSDSPPPQTVLRHQTLHGQQNQSESE